MTRAGDAGMLISARTGAGLAELRGRLSRAVGLANWRDEMVTPLGADPVAACGRALSVLNADEPDRADAIARLQALVSPPSGAEDHLRRGYN